jgi:hypothetical protein
MRFVPQYTVPVHLVILANADGIDDVMFVAANMTFDDMLKSPVVTPDMPLQALSSITDAGAPDSWLISRKPVGKFVTPLMFWQVL